MTGLKRITTPLAIVLIVAVAVGIGVWLLVGAPRPGGRNESEGLGAWPPPSRVVALGRSAYQANCAVCHGVNGEGEPNWKTKNADGTYPAPPHDGSGHTWHHPDRVLLEIVGDGGSRFNNETFRSRMLAWREVLTDEEIRAVITYLKTFWGPEERAFQAKVGERSR